MRKFCSTCGGQLELSKRFCTECGAVNPFFVSAFSLLGDQSGELERLRIEKERIEREMREKEQAHQEFLKQEQLKKQLEELERQKRENLEREKKERERIEAELKSEISRVKEESEAYKKKTIGLLKEIQDQLQQKIAEEIPMEETPVERTPVQTVTPPAVEQKPIPQPEVPLQEKKKKSMAIPAFVVAAAIIIIGIIYINMSGEKKDTLGNNKQQELSSSETAKADSSESMFSKTAIDSVPREINPVATNVTTMASPPVKSEPAPAVIRNNVKPEFALTSFRVKADLIGKPLSGCGITIQRLSEINKLGNLRLVERMPSGYLKYKFDVRVIQNNEIFTSTPYVYYTPTGRFLKIDGTNCE